MFKFGVVTYFSYFTEDDEGNSFRKYESVDLDSLFSVKAEQYNEHGSIKTPLELKHCDTEQNSMKDAFAYSKCVETGSVNLGASGYGSFRPEIIVSYSDCLIDQETCSDLQLGQIAWLQYHKIVL